jgi:hypothetical protein
MQPHNKVALSCLRLVVKQFFYFVKCDCKHSDDQRIVKDANTTHVNQIEWVNEHGDVHTDDGK